MMPSSTFDSNAIARTGFEALHNGDARAAREAFERVIAAGRADAAVHAALGYACARLDDNPAALAAADNALALDPRNLRALIIKADGFAKMGDGRAAASFYRFALNIAPPPNQLPPDLRNDLVRAEECLQDAFATDVRPAIRDWRAARGLPADPLEAFREGGYLQKITAARAPRAASPSSYA